MSGRFWNDFVERYTRDAAYWYVPKGKVVSDLATIRAQLGALKQFEGRQWRATQRDYIDALHRLGLTRARTADDDLVGVPMARMLKQVFSTLGLAWIDERDAVTLTPAGDAFVTAARPDAVIARQVQRYQFHNPMVATAAHRAIRLHPVPYLLEVLAGTGPISVQEYVLFCAKAKDYPGIEDSIDTINRWRDLGPKQRGGIVRRLRSIEVVGAAESGRRSSIYNTIDLDAPYAMAFWGMAGVIELAGEEGQRRLRIPRGRRNAAEALIRESQRYGQFIEFASRKDWMAYFGDPDKKPNRETALGYYAETSQIDRIQVVLAEMPERTDAEKRQYISMLVNEKHVEDILEHNLALIEPGLTLVGRQYATEVGRIDLFARDRNGVYTVIELKKGRTDDDVFGQVSRYMGWCRKTRSRGSDVRGIIIGKTIGRRLWAAADAHNSRVELMEYDLRISLGHAVRPMP